LFKACLFSGLFLLMLNTKIQVRNDAIRKLDNDLKNVEKFSTDLVKRTKNEAEQQENSETKASDGRK